MGDSSQRGPDDVVAFVHTPEQDVAEVKGPDPVVVLEADGVVLQRIGEEEQPRLQSDGARVRRALDTPLR